MTSARSALLFFLLAAGACAGILLGACGKTDTSSVTLVEADAGIAGDATLAPNAWGNTPCGTCALAACSAERATCAADPLCARNLDCLAACDVDKDQEPAAACVAKCPDTSGSTESEAARGALEICRTRGPGAVCDSCYGGAASHYAPALTNVCDSPHWDAGPDATPADELRSECQGERCCTVRDACENDPDCSALVDCIIATNGDTSMQPACYAQYDSAVAEYGARFGCIYAFCASIGSAPDDCTSCEIKNCADPLATCTSSHDCFLLLTCVADCAKSDAQCEPNCFAKYPGGADSYYGFTLCEVKACLTVCSSAGGM